MYCNHGRLNNLLEVDFISSSVHGNCSFAGRVCDCVLDNFWKQHVTYCTRFRNGQILLCLDWILTDNPDIVDELTYNEPIGKSDHVCLSWEMSFDKQQLSVEAKYNYWEADYPAIRQKLMQIVSDCIAGTTIYAGWTVRKSGKLKAEIRKRAWSAYARNRSNDSCPGRMKSSVDQIVDHACREHSQSLNLSHLDIAVVPVRLCMAKHLVRLQLNNNRLVMPPEEVGDLDRLQELSLEHNQLTILPSSLFRLVHLTYLNVSYNPLAVLSPDIGNLTSLTQLWLIDIQLDTLPSDIGRLSRLQKLSVRSNRLLFLPPTFVDLISLQWLHLAENCLTELPDGFTALKNLTYLNLDSNRLTAVPECLGSMSSLTSISLRKNRIRQLSDKLFEAFAKLSKLDLRDTQIISCPEHWKGVDFILLGKSGQQGISDNDDVNHTHGSSNDNLYSKHSHDRRLLSCKTRLV